MSRFAEPPPVVVQKYGGSSVADVERIRAVARRVVETVRAGKRVVVVVSAMGNTTSELLALARQVSHRPRRRELDLLVSVGERITMTLLAMAIEELGVPAASFTGSQSGIVTDERHVEARVVEVRPWRVQRALEEGKVAIVAGFQGVSRAGEVTTLGRGGSDVTAVVLAAALGAENCEICSDVDGIWTADPRRVPGARRLDALPLDAAATLTRAGARVLHAEAVEQARRLGVHIEAAATARPPGSGTRLPPGPVPGAVVAVAGDDRLALYELAEPRWPDPPEGGLPARAWLPGDGGRVRVLVETANLHEPLAPPPGGRALGPVAAVTAVGRDAVRDPARLAAVLAAARPEHGWWAAGDALALLVAPERLAEVERAVHDFLVTRRESAPAGRFA